MILNETILTNDRLVLFGFGLFETLLITDRGPLFAELHWQRMSKGAKILGLKLPDKQEWLQRILEFIQNTPDTPPFALRVTLSGGAPLTNHSSQLLFHKRLIPYTPEQYTLGIQLHLLPYPRNEKSPLCNIKSANYLENILAKEEANRHECEEGLLLNTRGFLAEGTMSNLFFIKAGTLFTPSLESGCLPGIIRQIVLDLAHSEQISTQEGLYTLSDLMSSDEIFMTNSLMGLMPVRSFNRSYFPVSSPESKVSKMRHLEKGYLELVQTFPHNISINQG